MASVCLTQNRNHLQPFQLLSAGSAAAAAFLLQQQQQNLQEYHQHQHQTTATTTTTAAAAAVITTLKHQPIAPAPTTLTKAPTTNILGISNSINVPSASGIGSMQQQKKKYTYANMPYGEQLPSVARRNARERNRVKQVNNGFANLRQHIPQTIINTLTNGGRGASKKLSKVDTLRIAVEYIRGLQDMLDSGSGDESSNIDDDIYNGSQGSASPSSTHYTLTSPVYNQNHHGHKIPFSSEASASPTPSYSDSDISIGGANYLQPPSVEEQQQLQMQFKFEPYDNYGCDGGTENAETPDDEEILDYISSWQED